MLKIPVKRILLAAATASSLAAAAVPQAASAAEVRCRSRSSCETPFLQASRLYFAVSAHSALPVPARGSFEIIMRDARNGHIVRVSSGRFSRSASGQIAAGPFGQYKLRVSSLGAEWVEARLRTP